MDPALWIEVKSLVAEAAELGPAERIDLFERAAPRPEVRREAESLLAALDAHGSLFEEPLRLAENELDPGPSTGDRVGAYRLLERLGGGGMGEVFLARQEEPIERQVAVKFIRGGLESDEVVRRFEAERQALAMMGHRCIAKVFEVGSHDGRPFLVMERIDGEPIDRFCDGRRLGVEQRLALFMEVCHGVQHAHMKGVIHRDLKPSNILVVEEDGAAVAKIIDFGIARFVEQGAGESTMTLAGQWLGTPDYMSPEQAAGAAAALDTRSDVFSLGVLLYELLCGSLPLDAREIRQRSGLAEWLRVMREEDPPTLGASLEPATEAAREAAGLRGLDVAALARRLRGDLAAVVSKALARSPEHRYQSPDELAADLARHLRDEPVLARAPAAAYVARKWIRRHRLAVAMASILLLSLALGLVGVAAGLVRAREAEQEALEEARRAQREASTAREVKAFLVELFNALNTEDPTVSPDLTLRQLLDRGALRVRRELTDQPLVRAELMVAIGRSYASLAVFEPALELCSEGVEILRGELGEQSPKLAEALNTLGSVLQRMGRFPESESSFRAALAIWRRESSRDEVGTANALSNLAVALKNQGRFEEAAPAIEQALDLKRRLFGSGHAELGPLLTVYGLLRVEMGQPEAAVPILEQALSITERHLGADHPMLALPLNNLAMAHARLGRPELARPLFERAIALDEKTYGSDHLNVAIGLFNLGMLTLEAGDCRRSEQHFARTLEILPAYFPPEHAKILEVRQRLDSLRSGCPAPSDPAPSDPPDAGP